MLSAQETMKISNENKKKIREEFEREHSDIFNQLEELILIGAMRKQQYRSAAINISYEGILSKEEFIFLLDILEYKYEYRISWSTVNLTINCIYW